MDILPGHSPLNVADSAPFVQVSNSIGTTIKAVPIRISLFGNEEVDNLLLDPY